MPNSFLIKTENVHRKSVSMVTGLCPLVDYIADDKWIR